MNNNPAQALSFHVTDIAGCVLLSCADIIALGLLWTTGKLDKFLHSGAKIVISQAYRSDVFTFIRKTRNGSD